MVIWPPSSPRGQARQELIFMECQELCDLEKKIPPKNLGVLGSLACLAVFSTQTGLTFNFSYTHLKIPFSSMSLSKNFLDIPYAGIFAS
ncbi:hypothetical protein LRC442 [Methanocella arvoryzae MRE50]|uniref:Uncharacterized protein n=1 Tax=Methanocella arvoryzae (strain DSM 22066 / NBRC 105507 / MRE50) TaxID=351160 RepID=Q0W894_METAR|nr:hypothetical protein LRC442 [Methanocella arvoryzae MRE50]